MCTIILLFWASVMLIAQNRSCATCGNPIGENDSYKVILNKTYHPEHFTCSYCEKVISGKFFLSDGDFYHQECFAAHVLPKCAFCEKAIDTEYITYQDKTYHQECYSSEIAPRCSLCGGVIEDAYIEDYWGNPYHSSHQGEHPQCWYCGRFVSAELTSGGILGTNDNVICSLCLDETVDELSQARILLNQVRKKMIGFGIDVMNQQVELILSRWPDLKQLTRIASKNHTGFTESEVVYYNDEKLEETFKIYILHNMPTYHFIATAAHELMHVWQRLNGSSRNQLITIEGSCNYASYLILSTYEDKRAKYILESLKQDDNPIYGDGFRLIKEYVGKNDLDSWLKSLHRGEFN
jgi:hypothetical protein